MEDEMPKKKKREYVKVGGALGDLIEAVGGMEAFCKAVGVTNDAVWKWNSGKRKPQTAVCKLAGMLARMHSVDVPAVFSEAA